MEQSKHFTLEELSLLSGVSPRTIRFYMQKGLVDKSEGTTRASYYHEGHLEQLMLVKRWQTAGLSLERIQEIACGEPPAVPEPQPKPGEVRMESRIYLAPGVHLCLDAARAGLAPEQVRWLVRGVCALLAELPAGNAAGEDPAEAAGRLAAGQASPDAEPPAQPRGSLEKPAPAPSGGAGQAGPGA